VTYIFDAKSQPSIKIPYICAGIVSYKRKLRFRSSLPVPGCIVYWGEYRFTAYLNIAGHKLIYIACFRDVYSASQIIWWDLLLYSHSRDHTRVEMKIRLVHRVDPWSGFIFGCICISCLIICEYIALIYVHLIQIFSSCNLASSKQHSKNIGINHYISAK
jgi:hypothetical protein